MKPYVTFTLEFKSRIRERTLKQDLMSICPFDHLPRKIDKIKGKEGYRIQVFLPDVEYLEVVHDQLEKKSKDMEKQLNVLFSYTEGIVTEVEIGVVS